MQQYEEYESTVKDIIEAGKLDKLEVDVNDKCITIKTDKSKIELHKSGIWIRLKGE